MKEQRHPITGAMNSIAGGRVDDDLKELVLSRGFLTSPGFDPRFEN